MPCAFTSSQCVYLVVAIIVFLSPSVQEFPLPEYRNAHLEASQLLQQQQLRRRPSLLSEFHPGADRYVFSLDGNTWVFKDYKSS